MGKIDPSLKFLQQEFQESSDEIESTEEFAIEADEGFSPKVRVLLKYTGDPVDLEQRGVEIRTVAGSIISGVAELSRLDEIAALPELVKIESSRPMTPELDKSIPEIGADLIHTEPIEHRGSGVVVGIIDTGIDFTHPCFRHEDGTSRILAIWDQNENSKPDEANPEGYSYGVEYIKAEIDAALGAADPFSVVRHQDTSGHGTHVAGIAAGNGSAAHGNRPALTYVGVAPDADVVVVKNNSDSHVFGDSANTLDAISYIFNKAASFNKPVVINMSLGDNLGAHDGTSLLEQGIDSLLGGPGQAMVKSAGNEGASGRHASGTVPVRGSVAVQFEVDEEDNTRNYIDIWYSGADRFDVKITPPGGDASEEIKPDTEPKWDRLSDRSWVRISSDTDDPENHDNQIYIEQAPADGGYIQPGLWTITLTGETIVNGRFDAWIERGRPDKTPKFMPPYRDDSQTISIPGTSREVISVASYISHPGSNDTVNQVAASSSRGPTRDNRPKPDIVAPGKWIMSAMSSSARDTRDDRDNGPYILKNGTSMAAPHVTGAIALMLQRNGQLTQAQLRDHLAKTARLDKLTSKCPNQTWGRGKLDAKAAFDSVSKAEVTISIDFGLKEKLDKLAKSRHRSVSSILEQIINNAIEKAGT